MRNKDHLTLVYSTRPDSEEPLEKEYFRLVHILGDLLRENRQLQERLESNEAEQTAIQQAMRKCQLEAGVLG